MKTLISGISDPSLKPSQNVIYFKNSTMLFQGKHGQDIYCQLYKKEQITIEDDLWNSTSVTQLLHSRLKSEKRCNLEKANDFLKG